MLFIIQSSMLAANIVKMSMPTVAAEMVAEPTTRPQRITRARASRRDMRGRSVVTFPLAEKAIDPSSLSLKKQIDTQLFF